MNKTVMLKKNYEFKNTFIKGKAYKENEIVIFIQKNNKKANFLGIAIGTKNGKAFQRNRAKRIIRECYTKLENRICDGQTIVVLMNKNFKIEDFKYTDVLKEMENIFCKAKILKEE